MTKVCRVCGTEFHVKPSQALKRFTCNVKCMAIDYVTRLKGAANPNYRAAAERTCARCGAAFLSYNKKRVYCGQACYDQHRRPEPPPARQLALLLTAPTEVFRWCTICGVRFESRRAARFCPGCRYVDLVCTVCEKPYRVHRSQATHRRTCGTGCVSEHQSRRQRGAQSHRWRGGKTSAAIILRSSFQYDRWRVEVMARDDFTCALCGLRGNRLAVHHIKPVSTHPDLALEPTNGITLCWTPCHTSIKGKEAEYEAQFAAALWTPSDWDEIQQVLEMRAA